MSVCTQLGSQHGKSVDFAIFFGGILVILFADPLAIAFPFIGSWLWQFPSPWDPISMYSTWSWVLFFGLMSFESAWLVKRKSYYLAGGLILFTSLAVGIFILISFLMMAALVSG
ncbi:MAG TPA: hypothetical protein VJN71_08305 [Nitrososphaerales archaeon]|nr:hypothetical protein [Nitrososphaerales archaeon]